MILSLGGCHVELDDSTPLGSYLHFREALLSADAPTVWHYLSRETRTLYSDALQDLQSIQEAIGRLPPSDREIITQSTGLIILRRVDSPYELFEALTRLENLVGMDTYRIGSGVKELIPSEDGRVAVIITEADQYFTLNLNPSGQWRVDSLTSIIQETLRPITGNLLAIEAMVASSGFHTRTHDEIVRILSDQAQIPAPQGEPAATTENDTPQ